jgi:hypothetical protein
VVSAIILLVLTVQAFVAGPVSTADCASADRLAGFCSVDASIGDSAVNLVGTDARPGANASSGTNPGSSANAGASRASGTGRGAAAAAPEPDCVEAFTGLCRGTVPKSASASTPPPFTTTALAVTLRDIASFRPAPGTQLMEPDGWVVTGLDANFYAITGQQLVPGTLLGQPATVRFTPLAYRWNYGDGSTAVHSTPGGTWASQGLHDFDPTATSHVYAAQGEYIIRLTIDFRAEYAFAGGGFVPISGVINLPANDLHVRVTGAKTVLVAHDCIAVPTGPGC